MTLTDDQLGFIAYRAFYVASRVVVTPWADLDEGVKRRWVVVGGEVRLALEDAQWAPIPHGLEEILREYPGE